MLTSFDIANYFIWAAKKAGESISNLKLLKLVYYAQGLYLALYDKPLFPEAVLAWKLGPVVEEIYHAFKGSYQVQDRLLNEPDWSIYPSSVTELLTEIYATLGRLPAATLSNKTHLESPWTDTQQNDEITTEAMRNFFKINLDRFGFVKEASPPIERGQRTAFEFYLESEDEWAEVYQRLAVS